MTTFWSLWIIVITIGTLVGVCDPPDLVRQR